MATHHSASIARANRPLILLVDDSVDVIRLLALLLSATCDVIFATDGKQGLSLAQARLPDLILLDVEMPVMNGRQVWSALQGDATTSRIPVIFVSADDPRDGDPDGGWIRKPFTPQEVLSAVHDRLLAAAAP